MNNSSSCPPDETLNYFKRHFNHGNNADRSGELDDVPDFVESLRKLSSTIDINNEFIHSLRGTRDISEFIQLQQSHYTAHVIRVPSERSLKQLMFNDDACRRRGRPHKTQLEQVQLMRMNLSMNFVIFKQEGVRMPWGFQ